MNLGNSIAFESSATPDDPLREIGYDDFRRRYFAAAVANERDLQSTYGWDEEAPRPHPLAIARTGLRKARESLLGDLTYHPERFAHTRAHALRLLAIPSALDSPPAWWKTAGCFVIGEFVPNQFIFRWLKGRLSSVNCYEGRQLLMRGSLRTLLFREYTPALDFLVRHVRGPVPSELLKDLTSQSVRWLSTLHRLGCSSVTDLAQHTRRQVKPEVRGLASLLCSAGVIVSIQELENWPGLKNDQLPLYNGIQESKPRFLLNAQMVVRQLVELRVDGPVILAACTAEGGFAPKQLESNVAQLRRHGIDPAQVLAEIGNLLWTASPARWQFLLDDLLVRVPADIALFKDLLRGRGGLPVALGCALVARQVPVVDLAACQSVLLAAGALREPDEAAQVWELLIQPPFSFTAADFAKVREYLSKPARLPGFLQELARHRLVNAKDVLAFDPCIASMEGQSLGRWLDVAMPRLGQEPLAAVADWVRRANATGSVIALETLVNLVDVPSLADLERALMLVPIGANILGYLVEHKSLSSLSKLLKWFRNGARGILDMKLYGTIGEVERLLLDDAFERETFISVAHNVSCAITASHQRATAKLGARPRFDDTQACSLYDAKHGATRAAQLPELLSDVRRLLECTSGVLFASFLAEIDADGAAFERRLASISPLIDQLVAGGGPSSGAPSQVEVEAVALVYATAPTNVLLHWPQLVGREGDIAGLRLARGYPMRWQQARRELQPDAKLDDRGLVVLSKIAGLAREFNELAAVDMEAARKGLRPSRIDDVAADVQGLALHLAVVCGLLAADPNVAAALDRWEVAQGAIGGGPVALSLLEQMRSFFATTLADAIEAHLPARLERMNERAARQLAERLTSSSESLMAMPAGKHLTASVIAVSAKLKSVFGAWAKKQDDKFSSTKDAQAQSEFVGVVSKTPAAFFAKDATGLCTRHNTDMWNEARHSHLVVFDPVKRRLAGMAMLYVQPVVQIDDQRQTLIIRAINPRDTLASKHDVASIVDSFLAIAIDIAKANGLAAVALPGDDSHLLSNVHAVERHLCERYARDNTGIPPRSVLEGSQEGKLMRPWLVHAPFDGYEEGQGQVSSLHVIWRQVSGVPMSPGKGLDNKTIGLPA